MAKTKNVKDALVTEEKTKKSKQVKEVEVEKEEVELESEELEEVKESKKETKKLINKAREICGEECEITVDTVNEHYWNYKKFKKEGELICI